MCFDKLQDDDPGHRISSIYVRAGFVHRIL